MGHACNLKQISTDCVSGVVISCEVVCLTSHLWVDPWYGAVQCLLCGITPSAQGVKWEVVLLVCDDKDSHVTSHGGGEWEEREKVMVQEMRGWGWGRQE